MSCAVLAWSVAKILPLVEGMKSLLAVSLPSRTGKMLELQGLPTRRQ